jgi:hypothetical protein
VEEEKVNELEGESETGRKGPALGVTKFTNSKDIILVTLCCDE